MADLQPKLNATAALRMSPAEYDKHRLDEINRRAEFAQHFPQHAASIDKTIISNLPSDVDAREVILSTVGRNEEEDEKLAEVRKVHRRMAEAGVIPATVVNICPWEVQATGVHLMYSDMTIPKCPIGTAYVVKIIDTYKIDIEDKGGRFGADVVTPIGMAKDIVQQLQSQKRGGLFCYMGNHRPGENPKTREAELKLLDKAKKQFIAYAKTKYREAEAFARQTTGRQLMNIVDEHRLCFLWLQQWRFISPSVEPTWLTATREEGDIPNACPKCGGEVGGGFTCGNGSCDYILDPKGAYIAGEIEDEHQSLRRLSREELDELGLEYVMTKDEYRTTKRKEALEGRSGGEAGTPASKGKGGRKAKGGGAAAVAVEEKED